MTTVAELLHARKTFVSAPRLPLQRGGGELVDVDTRAALKQQVDAFVAGVTRWRAQLLKVQQDIAATFIRLAEMEERRPLHQALSRLTELIDEVGSTLAESDREVRLAETDAAQLSATLSPAERALARQLFEELLEAGIAQHDARVDFHSFLAAIRAEYSPDSRGGPVFDDPVKLAEYLDKAAG